MHSHPLLLSTEMEYLVIYYSVGKLRGHSPGLSAEEHGLADIAQALAGAYHKLPIPKVVDLSDICPSKEQREFRDVHVW